MQTAAEPWNHKEVHYKKRAQYPILGGKAASVRETIMFLHHCLEGIALRGSVDRQGSQLVGAVPWFRTLRSCVHNLASYIHKVSNYPVLLSPEQAASLRKTGSSFVALYVRLAAQFLAAGETQFKIRPKLHYFHHMQLEQGLLNPKVTSCWNDETFIGNVTSVAGKTHRRTMPLRTLQRYLQCLRTLLQ